MNSETLAAAAKTLPGAGKRRLSLVQREALIGFLLISPWLIGFLLFEILPVLSSLFLSFNRYAIVDAPEWVGWANYQRALFKDKLFWKSLWNTVYYVGVGVPLRVTCAFIVALVLNAKIRGILGYRIIYYLPSIIPIVGTAVLWSLILNPRAGIINFALSLIGLPSINWLGDPAWSKPAFILMSLWTLGGSTVIFLAGLQGIPTYLYEVAEIDGANAWRRFWAVTVPLMTPSIFLNTIMNIIGSFQVFAGAYIVTGGGPLNSTLFYMLHLYRNAFAWFKMGYASALAWVLFIIIVLMTIAVVRSSESWVFYQGGR